jgi:hypothetical protein
LSSPSLLEDADSQTYLAECNQAMEAAGLHVEKVGYCPLLVAEHLLVQAEWALMDVMESVTGISKDDVYGDMRKKYLDLILSMLSPLVKNPLKRSVTNGTH